MINNWTKIKISELCDLIVDCVNKTAPSVEYITSYKMIRTPNIKKGRVKTDDCRFVKKETYEKWTRRAKVLKGDVLLTREAPMGEVGIITNEEFLFLGQRIMQYRTNPLKLNSKYLLYSFLSPDLQYQFRKHNNTGSIVSHIRVPDCYEFEISLPPLSTQQKIAKVLSDLDSKIEINNKINVELEAMSKTLYDYWFVQFDFPDANGKPYKTSGGKMVWNEELKREIPEGWGVKSINNYAEVKKGDLITAKDSKEGNIKVVAAGISYSYKHSISNRDKNTITISGSGANAGFINFWREPIFASDCITVRGYNDTITLMLLHHLRLLQNHILSQATGSAQPHVYPSDIKILNYIISSDSLIEQFGKIVLPINDKIANNLKENQELASLRDWLLPMLMNGQVSVGDGSQNDIEKDETLAMIAEPLKAIKTEKKKETKVVSIKSKPVEIYKRTLLAAEIVYQLHNEATLGHLKLQKLLYLCQQLNNMTLPMNFLKQAMGPYDNRLMRSIDKQFEEKKWFKFEKTEFLKYKPLGSVGTHQNDYLKYFEEDKPKIDYLIATFRKYKSHDIEAVATLYACWKEALDNKELVNLELMLKKFYNWSEEKEKFKPEELKNHLNWMKSNGICPKKND